MRRRARCGRPCAGRARRSSWLWWSEGSETLFGYEVTGLEPSVEFFTDRLHPDDRERVLSGIREAIQGAGSAWSGEYRFMKADGSYGYVFYRRYVIREDRRAVRMIGAMMDINAQARGRRTAAERGAIPPDRRDHQRMDLGDGPRGKDDHNNQAIQNILGYAPEELAGEDTLRFIHPEDLPAAGSSSSAARPSRPAGPVAS
ncbi:MAG: PAS domain-containing protein [Thermoanaerobaculia bacterium]